VVFEAARSSWLNEPHRALKVFDPIVSAAARSALLAEFEALTGVRHPHLLAGIDAFDLTEAPFAGCVVFVLELADEDLSHRVARRGPLPPDEVAAIGAQVADGLSALHAEGRIHGDVKPENILRAGDRWALGDFGVSGLLEGSYAVTAGATIDYRPPELARAAEGTRLHRSADIWALGVTLHVAATGRHPFPGPDPIMRFAAAVRDDRQPAPGLDPALARSIDDGCLAPEPRHRLDAPTLADHLRAWPSPPPVPAPEESVGTLSLAPPPAPSSPPGAVPLTLRPDATPAPRPSVEASVGSLPLAPPGDAGATPLPPGAPSPPAAPGPRLPSPDAPSPAPAPASWAPSSGALPQTPPTPPAPSPPPTGLTAPPGPVPGPATGGPTGTPPPTAPTGAPSPPAPSGTPPTPPPEPTFGRRTFDVAGGVGAAAPPQIVGAPPVVGPPAATAPPVASAALLGGTPGPAGPWHPSDEAQQAAAVAAGGPGTRAAVPWVGVLLVGVLAFVATQVVAVAAGELLTGLGTRRLAYALVSLLAVAGLAVGAGPRIGSTRWAAVAAGAVWIVATVGLFLR
jgi:serine/threonine-protein kinase